MRIKCPHCGERDVREFQYLGDAKLKRPDAFAVDSEARFVEYVYLRDNIAGRNMEYWYHTAGCQCWLKVDRHTRTHEIFGAVQADAELRADDSAAV
jgi:heterotetrameric sarcosine oxidase delta subunit